MPDPNEEIKDIEGEALQVDAQPSEEKRRIKPVIEEVASDTPEVMELEEDESLEESQNDEVRPSENLQGESHHEEAHHNHEHEHETEPSVGHSHNHEESKSDIKLFVLIAVITAVVVAALAGGIYVYLTGTQNSGMEVLQTPEPTANLEASPEPTPESSPSSTLKLSEYKVQILNGSGKIGEAGKAKTLVEKAGFKVGNTGNAETFDFTDTIIQVKSSVSSEVVDKLKDSMSSTYSVKVGDKLDSDSEFDIVVTVGSK